MKLKTKPTGIYFIEFEGPDAEGVIGRRRVSLDTRDKNEARAQMRLWAAGSHPKQLAVALASPKVLVKKTISSTGWTVSMALERCLDDYDVWRGKASESVNASNVKALAPICGEDQVADLTYERVGEIIQAMRDAGAAPGTISRRLSTLSMAVTRSMIWKDPKTGKPYLSGRPIWPSVTVQNTQDRVVTYEEETAIFAAIEQRRVKQPNRHWWAFQALVRVLLDTGVRLGEALNINKRAIHTTTIIDPMTGTPRVATFLELPRYSTKSKKPRRVPLSQAIIDLKPALDAQALDGKWFPWPKGATTPWVMWNEVREDLKATGIDLSDVKQHTFRHTCLTRLARGGMGLHRLKEWAGHHDIKVTEERYGHLCNEDLLVGLEIQQANYRKAEISSRYNDLPVLEDGKFNEVMRDNVGTAH